MKKYIKLLLVAVLAVVMMATLTGCGDAGKYKLKEIQAEGMTLTGETLAAFGMEGELYIQLNKDGTGVMALGDETESFTWKKGTLTNGDGETMKYTRKGKTLTIEEDGAKMIFEK